MPKKTSAICFSIIFFLLISLIWGCQPRQRATQTKACLSTTEQCKTITSNSVSIHFDTPNLLVETPVNIFITSKNTIKSIELSALNMNMGQIFIPLTEVKSSEDTKEYSAVLFLGMCSEPVMQWRMHVKFQNGTSEFFDITSYWSLQHIQSGNGS